MEAIETPSELFTIAQGVNTSKKCQLYNSYSSEKCKSFRKIQIIQS